ncbi:endoglucanase 13-like [Phragmites australis]|uniref:endoglucanase 13-like n=1 Tax=Phragmites australis TaxID=29695 RepID=UPI002D77095B|nr:endoglucanase 13-like [Phragmites australis]
MARLMIKTSATLLVATFLLLTAAEASFDYAGAFDKCLQFFEAQRSGKLPADHGVKWRGDSALTDGFSQGVDLVGGYYDSGDHVKFGFPMAYAVTMLSWGVLEFEKEMVAANNLRRALDAIRWGTNYFIKAHTEPNGLWVQVGDGDSDHLCWERAEDMTTPRTAFKIDRNHPGSEVAGETAAALAAAAKAFKPYDSMYSDLLLLHAKQLFTFADTFRGRYDDSLQSAKKFYPSASGYQDELLWSAAWLYEATGDEGYLQYVSQNAEAFGGTGWAVLEFSWDNKYAGLQVLLSKVLFEGGSAGYADTLKQYQAKAEFFLCACLQKNNGHNIQMTPGGLLYVDDWNNMQYVSSSTFLLTVYADYLAVSHGTLKCPDGEVKPAEILKFAKSQVDYILGKNPKGMSYMVGYGSYFPTHVHHRGASIPSIYDMKSTVGCMDGFDKYYNSKGNDPNVLHGAIVGGPDGNDGFVDDRCNYQHAEPTLAGNAPICGVFARLASEPTDTSDNTPAYSPPHDSSPSKGSPLEFVHTVTNSWKTTGVEYYRHVVTAKNTCGHPITYLKLHVKELSGPIYGLTSTHEKDMYEFPSWLTTLGAGEQLTIVYIQGGPAAKISVVSYKTA